MAKKKGGETEAQSAEGQGGGEKMTKAEAVRRAVAEGVDKPQEAVAFIKERYGIDMTPQHFSSYKSQQAKKEGKPAGRRGRKNRNGHESNGVTAGGSNGLPAGFSVEKSPAALARQIRQLVEDYGVSQVAEMVTVFSE